MIEIKNIEIAGIETAFRGMRNPLASWDKSDSIFDEEATTLGLKDVGLAARLSAAGNDHGKLLRQIYVGVDITAPLYWWKEMDQYKVGTTTNSESTMHTLTKFPITSNNFAINDEHYNFKLNDTMYSYTIGDVWEETIRTCETLRKRFAETGEMQYWDTLVRILPSAWLQMRTWTGNYAVLKNIYHARKNHKLSEWHDFCNWIESLPLAKELIVGENNG